MTQTQHILGHMLSHSQYITACFETIWHDSHNNSRQ